MRLIIATPSPFARKVRVVLREKNLACEEQVDLPWNPGTVAAQLNPLGKVPILMLDDQTVIHDSSIIAEYLEMLAPEPALIPSDPMRRLNVRQIETLADGICDAVVLMVLEQHRPAALQSGDWIARQRIKVENGVTALSKRLGDAEHFDGMELSLADIAVACALRYLDLRLPNFKWRGNVTNLEAFSSIMEARSSFRETVPSTQEITTVN
ncbi:MAG: glutathione S-transferase N-terminal domain-containing protein [Rhodospirillaceae bacterium]